jgi:tetratricopeptide (TPR) repeat protein
MAFNTFFLLLLLWSPAVLAQSAVNESSSEPAIRVPGSEACAGCHADISKSYESTAMATASGPASDGLTPGAFEHKPSGVHYRVYEQDNKVWMSFERDGKDGIHGQRELLYVLGSGKKTRAYLFSDQGFLFEAPINWYSQERRWNMTPGYGEAQEIPLNLPAHQSCLNCHTSGMQAPLKGTENNFSEKPFLHGGITCQRCHGSSDAHMEGKGPIVNPATLPPPQRDSICMECHFEGKAAVEQPGKHLYEFRPGEKLSDYVHYLLLTGNHEEAPRALSQFQALSLSACKRNSGDKMWCGSCHDAHAEPAAADKASYYRGKCLTCHGQAFAAKHYVEKPDCVECHMPRLPRQDDAHAQKTDHRIMRFPNQAPLPRLQLRGKPLVSFPEGDSSLVTSRDLALAWVELSQRNVEGASQEAEKSLRKAIQERPGDAALLSALAFVEQEHGRTNQARPLYEQALKIDPLANDAAANLGVLEARVGNLRRAAELWQGVFQRAPYRSAVGMSLAIVFCTAGQKEDARKYVERVLQFNPDYGRAKSLLKHLSANPVQCRP